jgi:toxin ParE1/3/4
VRLRWTPAAADDLQTIHDYLALHHPEYRETTIRNLYTSIAELKQFPYKGREGREQGTLELLFSPLPYVGVYRIRNDAVEILRIYHGAQSR